MSPNWCASRLPNLLNSLKRRLDFEDSTKTESRTPGAASSFRVEHRAETADEEEDVIRAPKSEDTMRNDRKKNILQNPQPLLNLNWFSDAFFGKDQGRQRRRGGRSSKLKTAGTEPSGDRPSRTALRGN